MLWFIVIGIAIESLHNLTAKIVYALGFSTGDVLGIMFDSRVKSLVKMKGLRLRRVKKHQGQRRLK